MKSLRKARFLLSAASLYGVLLVSGCPNPPPNPDAGTDMTSEEDLSVPPDLSGSCDPATGNCDMSMPPADMTDPPDLTPPPDLTVTGDMTVPPDLSPPADMTRPDGGTGTGGIGAPCAADTDCKAGPTPSCWKSNVLNNAANPATPGGYCSSECTSDAACGPWTHCVSMVGTGKKYCLASCDNATTCRKPGYACRYYGGDGVCYPDSIYDCSPKVATCTEKGTGKPGGCVREAYEDKGTCAASCTAGTGTCASVGTIKRQCVYWDATKATTGDLWKGLICMRSPATPVAAGGACNYVNECTDGYQCDGPFGLCRQLCNKTGAPTCIAGTCTDVFGTSTTPGLCR